MMPFSSMLIPNRLTVVLSKTFLCFQVKNTVRVNSGEKFCCLHHAVLGFSKVVLVLILMNSGSVSGISDVIRSCTMASFLASFDDVPLMAGDDVDLFAALARALAANAASIGSSISSNSSTGSGCEGRWGMLDFASACEKVGFGGLYNESSDSGSKSPRSIISKALRAPGSAELDDLVIES